MNDFGKKISDLHARLTKDTYKVEIDTEDTILGFKKTLTKRTKSYPQFLNLKIKTAGDVGRYLSLSVRVVEVRWYKNGTLLKTLSALPLN